MKKEGSVKTVQPYFMELRETVARALKQRLPVERMTGWDWWCGQDGVWRVSGMGEGSGFRVRFLALVELDEGRWRVQRIHTTVYGQK